VRAEKAADIILFNSVKQCDSDALEDKSVSFISAEGKFNEDWLASNAENFARCIPSKYFSILQLSILPDPYSRIIYFIIFIFGVLSNYFGPSGKIHVLYNPITILISWNLFIYIILIVFFIYPHFNLIKLLKIKLQSLSLKSRNNYKLQENPIFKDGEAHLKQSIGRKIISGIVDSLIISIWLKVKQLTFWVYNKTIDTRKFVEVTQTFWSQWFQVANHLVIAKWKRLLHCGAIALSLGAMTGIYLRGLVFDYNVVWTSTFIKNDVTINFLIKSVLGPAIILSRVLGQNLGNTINVAALLSQNGESAATWIHLYFISTIIFIFLPRTMFALLETRQIKKYSKNILINVDSSYLDKIESLVCDNVKKTVNDLSITFSEDVSVFVRDYLYLAKIVPLIEAFRMNGGEIAELKESIEKQCKEFQPEIVSYVNKKISDYKIKMVYEIESIVRSLKSNFSFSTKGTNNWAAISNQVSPSISYKPIDSIGDNLSNAIALIVGTAFSAIMGTISGGLGSKLGLAIIVTLTGTSGPVGLIIGALIGLVIALGAWWLGRDIVTQKVEHIHIPGIITRKILRTSKYNKIIEDGKKQTYTMTKEQIKEKLLPVSQNITDEICFNIKKILYQ